jgi:tetratricopeptide (TPR) repeat protein
VSATTEELVDKGMAAFSAGDMSTAHEVMTEAVAEADAPLARLILGGLTFAREEYSETQAHWEAAFRSFKDAGDMRGAALAATYLGSLHYDVFGNESVSRGWLSRAGRLLDRAGRCVERGYYELATVACSVRDTSALEESAAVALDLALEINDPDLEARALADGGLAMINQGRLKEGFARMDEAMAPVVSGEIRNPVQGAMIFCALLTSCERTGDLRRAEEWTKAAAEFTEHRWTGRLDILHSHCRVAHGTVLCDSGRFSEGESQLLTAVNPSGSVPHRADAAGALATLRMMQGRLEEAAELLAPYEDRFEVCEPLARLHFARGEYDLAAAVIDRALHELVGDRLRAGRLLRLLVDVELGRNDLDAADRAAERLSDYADESDSPVMLADARLADGRVAMRRDNAATAITAFEAGLDALGGEERPILAAIIRLDLAHALASTAQKPRAIDEARGALASFERLGARRLVERAAAFLKELEPAATAR